MEKVGGELNMPQLKLAGIVLQAVIRSTPNDQANAQEGERLAGEGLALAQALSEGAAEAKLQWILLNVYRFTGRHHKALEAGERSIQLAREHGLREQLAFSLNDMIHVYGGHALDEKAREAGDEAEQLWREMGNLPMLTDSLVTSSFVNLRHAELDIAIQKSEEAYAISQETNNLWGLSYSQYMIGLAHWQRGNIGRALNVTQAGYQYGDLSGFAIAQTLSRCWYAQMLVELGKFEEAEAVVEEAIALPTMIFGNQLHIFSMATRSIIHAKQGRERFLEAKEGAQRLGLRWILWQILFALAEMESNADEAAALLNQARKLVLFIAGKSGSEDIRQAFLNMPEAKAILTTDLKSL